MPPRLPAFWTMSATVPMPSIGDEDGGCSRGDGHDLHDTVQDPHPTDLLESFGASAETTGSAAREHGAPH
jgi:hypothetical protein